MKRKLYLLALAGYGVVAALASVVVLPWLVATSLRHRDRQYLLERLGLVPRRLFGGRGRVWFHAVSVGEAAAALPVIRQLLPECPIAVSTGTPAGSASLRRWLDERIDKFYLPLDFPLALDRLFRLMRPRALAIVETELWPGLIATAVRRGVPVFLINAKIPPADFPRYRATKALWRPILQRCHAILAASPVDRDRFLACGAPPARVTVAGDTKYDAALQASAPGPTGPLASLFARRPPDRLLVLLASTHSGEEDLLLRALRPLGARVQFVVAPRHVERADAVAAVLTRLGMSFERREPGHLTWSCDAVLWDTVGELAGLYAFSDLVVMGGSWKPCGGHNPLEPAAWVKPIVVGPHMENFHDTLADLTSCEALVTTTAEGLPAAVRRLLDDPAWRTQLGRRARARVEARAGAAGLCAAAIRRVLPATPTIQAERPVRRPRWARGRRGFRGFACWIAVGCCG